MKKILLLTVSFLWITMHANAQVGINTDGSQPDGSAMLDVKSATKGTLFPRIALTSANMASPVTSPATGLLVYNTATSGNAPDNVAPGFYFWNGSRWIAVVMPQGSATGEMLYWNGSQWVMVPAGNQGELLVFWNGAPSWGGGITLTTTGASSITATTATAGGNVVSTGGASVAERGVCWNTTGDPTTDNDYTADGAGPGLFVSQVTGLAPNTLYHLRAYAANGIGTSYGNEVTFTTAVPPFICGSSTFTDSRDSRVYQTVMAGGKCWMKQNLDIGSPIDGSSDQTNNNIIEKYCYNNDAANCSTYGGLYQWNEMMQYSTTQGIQGICPAGWKIPSDNEWTSIINFFGGESVAGGKMKETGTLHWLEPNTGATNSSGFTALPGGIRSSPAFMYLQTVGFWWTSSQQNPTYATYRAMDNNSAAVTNFFYHPKSYGMSVRCVCSSGVPPAPPTIISEIISTPTTATLDYEVTADGGLAVTASGVCWNTTGNPSLADPHTSEGTGTGFFTTTMTGLTKSTRYYMRLYATNLAGTAYGNEESFSTAPDPMLPTVETSSALEISQTTATGGGSVTNAGGSTVTARGICWNITGNPTLADPFTTDGTGAGVFTSQLTNLSANTTYFMRAYATNGSGTRYGDEMSFITLPLDLPLVTTNPVTGILTNTASSGGNVTGDGGSPVTARGVCWSETDDPTIAGPHTVNGAGVGSFTSLLTGMTPNTSQWVRAYATNSLGTAYGDLINFYTLAQGPPSVSTTEASSVTYSSAVSGGEVTYDGGDTVMARGVCWNTTGSPDIDNDPHTSDGGGTGSFTSLLTGLTANTTYYIRSFAFGPVYGDYGDELNFTTPPPQLPGVNTAATSAITCCGATSGGEVLSENGAAVTSRGVCWNTGGNPTIAGDHTLDGSGMGVFISQLSGLTANITYFVRAYATNSAGTKYGTEKSFATSPPLLPILTTTPASDITINSAGSGGNITNDGGSAVTSRGVCWNTSGNPSTAGQHTSDGTGSGAYTSELTGLGDNTTYHIRAFATNGAGTAYGNELTFTTLVPDGQPCPGTPIVWYGEKNYFTVQIGTQCWFRDNLNIGTRIDSSLSQTNNGVVEKYCYSDLEANCNVYGGLYQWAELVQYLNGASNTTTWDPVPAGNIQGLCPTGWHIPSDGEWATLTTYLGGTGAGGGKMKETGTAHWLSPNTGATNESGFTALPAGIFDPGSEFQEIFYLTHYWSSTQFNAANVWTRSLGWDSGNADRTAENKSQAISVRCIKN